MVLIVLIVLLVLLSLVFLSVALVRASVVRPGPVVFAAFISPPSTRDKTAAVRKRHSASLNVEP